MRILFSLDKFSTSDGGSDRLARAAVNALTQHGHILRIVESAKNTAETVTNTYTAHSYQLPRPWWMADSDIQTIRWNSMWKDILNHEIIHFKPDIILTQNMLAPATVAAAKQHKIKTTVLLHGYRCVSPTTFYKQDALTAPPPTFWNVPVRLKFKWYFVKKTLKLYKECYESCDTIIANSNYSSAVIKRYFNRDSSVFYPIMDLNAIDNTINKQTTQQSILFIKPQPVKGLDVLLSIAPILKHHHIIVTGHTSKRRRLSLSKHKNIQYLGWVKDMGEMYRQAGVLLGPSQYSEPFGRVFVEAGLYGVPSVGSDRAGIPEAMGDGGIRVHPDSVAEVWAEAIQAVLKNRVFYADTALNHAQSLINKYTPEYFNQLITNT